MSEKESIPAASTADTLLPAGTDIGYLEQEDGPEVEVETHGMGEKLNRLRAAVLGANDGIVSTAAVVVGVAVRRTAPARFSPPVWRRSSVVRSPWR